MTNTNNLRNISIGVISFLTLCFIFPVFREPIALYSSFTDDFFYYLKIASNHIDGVGMSFTPGILTNGYQPLHQLLIILLVYLSDFLPIDELVIMKISLGIVFFFLSLQLLKKINPSGILQHLLFCLGLVYYYLISYTGMESIFMVPLLTILFLGLARNTLSFRDMILLITLSFFVRIDSIVITLPLALYHVYIGGSFKQQGKVQVLTFCLLFVLPVAIYLFVNQALYGSAFPISGIAKSVIQVTGIHPAAFESVYGYRPYNIFNLCVVLVSLITIPLISPERRRYFIVLILAIILFYLQSSIRSDWKLWAWYFYPIPAISFVIASESFKRRNFAARSIATFGFMLGLFLITLYAFPFTFIDSKFQGKIDILHIAGFRIKDFEKQHKGIYAMGDRAGIAGYLIESPLIQLEGLVMDKKYLSHLRQSTKIREVLEEYKVDYYIASNAHKVNDSTYIVSEPIQSNGYSKKIVDTINWKIADQFQLIMPGLLFKNSFEASETTIFKVPAK